MMTNIQEWPAAIGQPRIVRTTSRQTAIDAEPLRRTGLTLGWLLLIWLPIGLFDGLIYQLFAAIG